MYGVSPQPRQAPEYSKSGSSHCEPFTSSRWMVFRSHLGEREVVLEVARARARCRPCATGVMFSALWRGLDLSLAGHDADAERAAGAVLGGDREHVGAALVVLGAVGRRRKALRRVLDRLRLDHLRADRGVRADQRAVVALDADVRIPDRDRTARCRASPTGWSRWATCRRPGTRSPADRRRGPPASRRSPAARSPARAPRRWAAGAAWPSLRAAPRPACRCASASSIAAKFCRTTAGPRLPYVFSMASLIASMATSTVHHAADREEAGLHDGVDADVRGPPPSATRWASMT